MSGRSAEKMQKNRRSDRRKAGMLLCFLLTALVLFVLVFLLSLFTKLSPVVFVVFCAAAGILLSRWGVRGK